MLTTARFLVLWVDATDAVTTEQSYEQIATAMFGSEDKKNPVQEVLLGLQKSEEEWLLVFDNAPPSSLAKYLPDGDRGNILYTSRQHNLQPRLRPECVASIDTMDAPEGILLLLRSAQKAIDVTENRELARAIVNALGLLPLAIDQAGAYIHMAPCPLDKYLAVFNEQKEVLLRSPRFKGSDEKRHIAVYATFNISYRAIKAFADKKEDLTRARDAKIALQLLNLICFYHNEGFIGLIFKRAAINRYRASRAGYLPLKAGEVELEGFLQLFDTDITPANPEGLGWVSDDVGLGLGFLNEFSLLKFDVSLDYFNMHILVHDWARDRLDSEDKPNWGLAARTLILESITFKRRVRCIKYRRDVQPHLEACLKRVAAEHHDPGLESEYLMKAAKVFQQSSNLDLAEDMLEKAVEYRKRSVGSHDPATLTVMNQLARLYADRANYAKAEDMFLEVIDRRALYLKDLKWQAFRDAHPAKAGVQMHEHTVIDPHDLIADRKLRAAKFQLINLYLQADNMLAAADIYDEFMRWSEEEHGKQSQEAEHYRNMAQKYRDANNFGMGPQAERGSIQSAKEELDRDEAELGPSHPSTMRSKLALARELQEAGALKEARSLLLDVYNWSKDLYGEDSLPHADALFRLADVDMAEDRIYDAGDLYLLSMKRYKRILGENHPMTLMTIQKLALSYYGRADFVTAAGLIEICRRGCIATLSAEHRLTRFCVHAVRQFRYYERTVPDHLRAKIENDAVEANKKAYGDSPPQWMRDWKPASPEAMIRARLERGETVRTFKMQEIDIEGFPFYELIPLKEYTGRNATEMAAQLED